MANILLVEDDPNQQRLYKQDMEDAGHSVTVASDGCEGLKKLESGSIDLVVLDISMPGMDGIEFIGKLLGRDNTIPIIVHTAYPQYKDNFLTWATEHYILKTPDTSLLLKRIDETLKEYAQKK